MHPSLLHLVRLLFHITPETRLFGFKSYLLRMAGINVGKNVRVCSSATILGSGCLGIGDDTWLGQQVLICAGSRVTIGKAVDIGPRVYIGTGTHVIDSEHAHTARLGITVGEKSVIAAGAVVTKDVPPRVLAGGIPARVIRDI